MTRGQRIQIKPVDDVCDFNPITMEELRIIFAEVEGCLPEEVDMNSWTYEGRKNDRRN